MAKIKRKRYSSKSKKTDRSKNTENVETKAVVKLPENEVRVVSRPKKIVRRTTNLDKPKVLYRKIVYVGTADKSTVRGAVTGKKYTFTKDKYKMPLATNVDERDYSGVIALRGKGCARRDPQALFITEQDWDLEIAEAKRANS